MLRPKQVKLTGAWAEYPRTRFYSDGGHWLLFAEDTKGAPLCFLFLGGLDTDERYSLSWNRGEGVHRREVDCGATELEVLSRSPLHGKEQPFDSERFQVFFSQIGDAVDQDVFEFVLKCTKSQ